jgi:hypothetical protein
MKLILHLSSLIHCHIIKSAHMAAVMNCDARKGIARGLGTDLWRIRAGTDNTRGAAVPAGTVHAQGCGGG